MAVSPPTVFARADVFNVATCSLPIMIPNRSLCARVQFAVRAVFLRLWLLTLTRNLGRKRRGLAHVLARTRTRVLAI